MSKTVYRLKRISMLMHVGAFQVENQKIIPHSSHPEENAIFQSEELRTRLMEGADGQEVTYVCKDKFEVCYFCVKRGEQYFLIGPMSLKNMNFSEQRTYCRFYGLEADAQRPLYHFSVARMLYTVETITEMLTGQEYEDYDILFANNIYAKPQGEAAEKIRFFFDEDERIHAHHTYKDELILLDYLREGKKKEALRAARVLDESLGELSKQSLRQTRNATIVGITICTRTGMEAGVEPDVAYRLSDYYIQKVDICNVATEILRCRDQFMEEIMDLIQKAKSDGNRSPYVKKCKAYIDQHFREKLYLDQMAEEYGISSGHLSRQFKKEIGVTVQDYINQVKTSHAANMLRYSDRSIAEISSYLNFASQSYFGTQFKKYYQMTPKQYREQNQVNG